MEGRREQAKAVKLDSTKFSFDIFQRDSSPRHRAELYGGALIVETMIQTHDLGHQSTSFTANAAPPDTRGTVPGVAGPQQGESLHGVAPDDPDINEMRANGYTYVCTADGLCV